MLQNYIEYIKVGVHMRYTRKNFISFVLVPSLLWPLFGAIPFGLLLSGYYELLSIAMITAGVVFAFVGIVFSLKTLTTKNRLIILIIAFLSFFIQNSLMSILFFTMHWGFNFILPAILLLPVALTVILFALIHIKLKNNEPIYKTKVYARAATFSSAGFVAGSAIVKLLVGNISQDTAFTIVIGGLLIINLFLILGFLNIQRLYYLTKLEKLGLVTEECFTFEEEQSNAK